QVAAAFGQSAVVHQQVGDGHLARGARVVHREVRQVLSHRAVPAQLAGLDQPRQHRGGHGLGVGGDLEQRFRGDRIAAAGDDLAEAARIDDLAILDRPHRDAGKIVALGGRLDGGVEHRVGAGRRGGGERGSRGCRRTHEQEQCESETPLHGDYSVAAASAAATSMTRCQTRSRLPPQIFAMSASLKPRLRSSAVTLPVSVASIQPVTPPPPSKSAAMPTWSIPATFAMCSMWSTYSCTVASGCSRWILAMPSIIAGSASCLSLSYSSSPACRATSACSACSASARAGSCLTNSL